MLILRDEIDATRAASPTHGRTLDGMPHRLLRWLPAVVAPVVVAGAIAVPLVAAATPPDLPTKSAQQVLELVAKSKDVAGFTGTVQQRSDLGLPSIPSTGAGSDTQTGSALDLISGDHTARVEVAGATKARIAILDPSAERDVIRDGRSVWLWDSNANSATHVVAAGSAKAPSTQGSIATPAEAAQELLSEVGGSTSVTVDTAQQIADRDAYTLVLTPRTAATTIGSVRIAVDAQTGLPLDVQVLARGATSPAFETGFTSISFTTPAASRFEFTPPSDAKVRTRTVTAGERPAPHGTSGPKPTVSGTGWASVVTVPSASVPADLAANATVRRLSTAADGGRVLHTALVNVLLTSDGRVLAGAVPVSRLESAAG
jgi:outer membrane lipoprotein-sorting protein